MAGALSLGQGASDGFPLRVPKVLFTSRRSGARLFDTRLVIQGTPRRAFALDHFVAVPQADGSSLWCVRDRGEGGSAFGFAPLAAQFSDLLALSLTGLLDALLLPIGLKQRDALEAVAGLEPALLGLAQRALERLELLLAIDALLEAGDTFDPQVVFPAPQAKGRIRATLLCPSELAETAGHSAFADRYLHPDVPFAFYSKRGALDHAVGAIPDDMDYDQAHMGAAKQLAQTMISAAALSAPYMYWFPLADRSLVHRELAKHDVIVSVRGGGGKSIDPYSLTHGCLALRRRVARIRARLAVTA